MTACSGPQPPTAFPVDGLQFVEEAAMLIQELSLAATLPEIMATVAEKARRLLNADGVTFVLREDDKCFYADEDAIAPLWKGRRFPLQACISGWVMINRQPAVIEDIYADPRVPADAYRPTFVRALAMVPVRSRDPVAAIGAYWARLGRPANAELRMLQAIADASALAIANLDLARAKQSAELSSVAASRYVAAAGHDLRQPLQSLFLFLEILGGSPLDSRARRALDRMKQSLTGLREMMDDLLDTARLGSGAREPRIESFVLDSILGPIAAAYEPQARSKGLAFVAEYPAQAVVRSDPLLLVRIVRNLLENAIRYTDEGGVSLLATCQGETIRISVKDSGIGIAAEHLTEIFEEFRQLPGGGQRGGWGLGLANVRRLSQALRHPLWATSQPGKGSTFEIEVPVG